MALEIRTVTDPEFDAWSDALDVGFYHPDKRGQGAFRRRVWSAAFDAGRVIGGFDGAKVVGTFQHFATPLTVPGGGEITTGAVTTVTVTPTHRRRGLLSGMMAQALRQSVDLGEAASILIPAEYPIYGRFGYGMASEEAELKIDATAASLARPLPGTVELVSAEEWCALMPAVYDRVRAATPGAIARTENRWRRDAGLLTHDDKPTDKESLFAVVRDEAGVPRGSAVYKVNEVPFENFRPRHTAKADVLAESAEARVRLFQFLWEHDWIVEFDVESQPVDDSYRRLLGNARAIATQAKIDVLWIRLLDVPAALAARTYETAGRLVIAVEDKDSYAAGVYALEGTPDGATCVRTTESPDLTMSVQTLGSLYLGGYAASALAEVGLVAEDHAGALKTADRMFKTAIPPYCATWF
jgi:predicted acetyltransferase